MKMAPHIMEVQSPQSTRNRALTGTPEAIKKPLSTLYPGIFITRFLGRRMATSTRTTAVEVTAMTWVRVLTLPLIRELRALPTIISSQ